jgi:ABC-2 type transport system permease protein
MTTGNSIMQLETGSGWSRGLNNVMAAEFKRWFGTRTWWVQILIWTAVANGILLAILATEGVQDIMEASMFFTIFLGIGAPIGVCIIMQEALVGEKQTGTASWVLSKPVSRAAFLLSKLVSNTVGIAVTMVLVPGMVCYLLIATMGGETLPIPGFLAGLGVILVYAFFFITLTLMLGAIFDHRGPVIGIPLAFAFAQQWIPGFLPATAYLIPWPLMIPYNNSNELSTAATLMNGGDPSTWLPVISTLAASLVFIVVSFVVFQRQEL